MIDSKERNADPKDKQKAAEKARREEQASIVQGLQTALEGEEQLLAFARGRIAGGWRGKLAVGPEAFFAPFVNLALTERRFLLQHIQPLSGKPSDILPHAFPLAETASLGFMDIETFGGEPAGRLVLRLRNDQNFRIRLHGTANVESARTMAELFRSLTEAHPERTGRPTERQCSACSRALDRPYKFCPYCGQAQPEETAAAPEAKTEETPDPADKAEAAMPPQPPLAPEPPPPPKAPRRSAENASAPPDQPAETPAERAEKEAPTSEEARQEQESETHGEAPQPETSEASPTEPGTATPPVERPAEEDGPDADTGGL